MHPAHRCVTELTRAVLQAFLATAPRRASGQFGPSAEEILQTLQPVVAAAPAAPSPERARVVAAHHALAAALRAEPHAPLAQLIRAYHLGELDVTLLALLLAPELEHDLERAISFAIDDFTRKRPDVGFLTRAVSAGDTTLASQVLERFDEAAPLRRHGLITVGTVAEQPLSMRPVWLADRVVAYVRGQDTVDELVRGCVRVTRRALTREALVMSPAIIDQIERALAGEGAPARLLLAGPDGAGRALAVEALLADRGIGVVRIDLAAIVRDGRLHERLAAALREAALREAAAILEGGTTIDNDAPPALVYALADALHELAIPVVFTFAGHPAWLAEVVPDLVELDVRGPTFRERVLLWRRALPPPLASEADLEAVAGRYGFTGGTIARTARRAEATARLQRPDGPFVSLDDLGGAARRMFSHKLGAMAQRIPTGFTWADLVLPRDTQEAVGEVVRFARRRAFLLEEWGFAAKLPYGRGVSAILAGPPGTGKTMVAQLLAHELGYDLFRIDLSQVVNKYIGETEKNLARIFDAAESSHAVLFFDEADSLFAKRTEVRSSNDKYANLEVNYLLQRMETYDGVTLLATNLEQGIDDAFKRRVRFTVQFELPEEAERNRLWRSMFPPVVPLDPQIDWARLAARYEMAGGYIKKAALRAALIAAETERPITMEDLVEAAQREYREMGRIS